jgi:putative sterol carrier protein
VVHWQYGSHALQKYTLRRLANICFLVTLSLSDEDFGKLVEGKANAQRLFMSGKLKVKGDVMKATKMEPILKKAQSAQAKL